MGATRAELIEAEIERLKGEAKTLERDWRRIPFLAAFFLLALPVNWIWGPTASFYAVLCVPCLVATAAYLIGVRKRENRDLLVELEDQLEDMAAAS